MLPKTSLTVKLVKVSITIYNCLTILEKSFQTRTVQYLLLNLYVSNNFS